MFDVMKPAPMLGPVRLLGQFDSWFSDVAAPGDAVYPSEDIAAGGQCYTCADPDGNVQYGVPSDVAAGLQNNGYMCHRDDCQQNQETSGLAGRIRLAPGLGRRALL